MYVVMTNVWVNANYCDADCITAEYSGVYHDTIESAEAELYELKLHHIDDETLKSAYIAEV